MIRQSVQLATDLPVELRTEGAAAVPLDAPAGKPKARPMNHYVPGVCRPAGKINRTLARIYDLTDGAILIDAGQAFDLSVAQPALATMGLFQCWRLFWFDEPRPHTRQVAIEGALQALAPTEPTAALLGDLARQFAAFEAEGHCILSAFHRSPTYRRTISGLSLGWHNDATKLVLALEKANR